MSMPPAGSSSADEGIGQVLDRNRGFVFEYNAMTRRFYFFFYYFPCLLADGTG